MDQAIIHHEDVDQLIESEYPEMLETRRQIVARTFLAVPLIREGVALGVIHFRRLEVRPFSDKQIALIKTFADQAVIAIENVRLFKELQDRNRDLSEALEQQTATSEILGAISSSPADLQPVFETILANATRLCGTQNAALFRFDGEFLRFAVGHNLDPENMARMENYSVRPGTETASRRAALERRTIHVPDVVAAAGFDAYQTDTYRRENRLSTLAVPLLKEDTLLGVIVTSHYNEVRPFTDNQIKLVETFADQAVIALENVRLFNELKESLEQQTATNEILGVIASSPTDLQPVLDIVAKTAARLCDAGDAAIWRTDGDEFWLVAAHGSTPVADSEKRRPLIRSIPSGRAMIDKETVHIHDVLVPEFRAEFSDSFHTGKIRTILTTPLLREGLAIGAIHIRRTEVRPFSEKQIALLKTFADQAVIAIENVRLFKELEERNSNCARPWSIRRQPPRCSASSAARRRTCSRCSTLSSRAPRGFAGSMMWCCDSTTATPWFRGLILVPYLSYRIEISIDEPQFDWMREHGTLHIPDASDQTDLPMSVTGSWRTFLVVPLRQQNELIGGLFARRTEVRPFTPAQIKLLETFADQAVIAIENARLFRELKEALEQQTATSEILGVIASSPTDIQPVLDVVAENAARLCDANDAQIYRVEGDVRFEKLQAMEIYPPILPSAAMRPLSRRSVSGRAIVDRQIVHMQDMMTEREEEYADAWRIDERLGIRTSLAVPLYARGYRRWCHHDPPHRSAAIYRQSDCAPQNLCRSSGDRYRERPIVPGT